MVNFKSRKLADILYLCNALVLLLLINLFASRYFFRADLTEDKRYSIKAATKEMLRDLDDVVYIEVFLEGEMNASFRRFQKALKEILDEFSIYSGNKVQYSFTDPATALSQKARTEFMNDLAMKGIQPINVVDEKDGERKERLLFPGALISYGGREEGVNLFKDNRSATAQETINQAIENMEYNLANAINKLSNTERKRIAWIRGHKELEGLELAAIHAELRTLYDVLPVQLDAERDLEAFSALLIARPLSAYSNLEKYKLDQYLMRGGNMIFMINQFQVQMDSASAEFYFPSQVQHNLDDMLFRYGVRINANLLQDRLSSKYPVVTGFAGNAPQMQMMDWYFFPLLNNYAAHPVTRNLDAILARFVSTIDTVKAEGIRKTPLIMSSPYTRVLPAPVNVSANELRSIQPSQLNAGQFPVAYLLEGKFTSLFKNRFLPEGVDPKNFISDGLPGKIIVVADGDLVRNEINSRTGQAQELGRDPFLNHVFANQDFVLNALAYLMEEDGLITTRNKEVRIRPLDKQKVNAEKTKWQIINLVLPILLILVFGITRAVLRKRRFVKP